jgi:hypothetical protein
VWREMTWRSDRQRVVVVGSLSLSYVATRLLLLLHNLTVHLRVNLLLSLRVHRRS